jgi:histidinol-phosphate aminotransferase
MKNFKNIIRKNVQDLAPYSSARDEFEGIMDGVFLDANENPFKSAVNRYPDPYQKELKEIVAKYKGVQINQLIIGNGSDEILDLIVRATCDPGKDKIVTITPTYGMYKVIANINDVKITEVPLSATFDLEKEKILEAAKDAKLIMLCSPNNPTGNLLNRNDVLAIAKKFDGILVVDEAYIDFSNGKTLLQDLNDYDNIFVCQTLSKAYGLAGIRVGFGFGSAQLIDILNKIKPPYNVNELSQKFAIARLKDMKTVSSEVMQILLERSRVLEELMHISAVLKIYRTDANFILFKVENADELYNFFIKNDVIVRNRTNLPGCKNCLRVTIGSSEENDRFLNVLKSYAK